jgi:hypothetical protein
VQVGAEQGRLVSAGAGANLDDAVPIVDRIAGHQHGEKSGLDASDATQQSRDFDARLGGHFGVIDQDELAGLDEFILHLLQGRGRLDDRHEAAVLAAQLSELLRIAKRIRVRKRPFDLAGAGESGR